MNTLGRLMAIAALAATSALLGACSGGDGGDDGSIAETLAPLESLEPADAGAAPGPTVDCVLGITVEGETTTCQVCISERACRSMEGIHTDGNSTLSITAYEPCVPEADELAPLPLVCGALVLLLGTRGQADVFRNSVQEMIDKQAQKQTIDGGD